MSPSIARLSAAALVLCSSMGVPAFGAAPDAVDWPALARRDLQFAADTIATRHAGVVDQQPSVTIPLAAGLRAGLAEAAAVRGEQDYLRLMMRFLGGFGDPHTAVDLGLSPRGWTGIVLDQVDGRYRVVWSEPGWPSALPPVGAHAQSCDEVYTGTYLQLKVAPFLNRSAEYAGTFGTLAQQSMFDIGLGWTPSQCVFALPDGSLRRYALPLRAVPAEVSQARLDALRPRYRAAAAPVGVRPLGAGRYWVGMPNFDGRRSGPAYEALYPALAALSRPAWVVFDLRGNGGGDSGWGRRALASLYGAGYSDRLAVAGGAQKYLIADAATVGVLEHYLAAPEFAGARERTAAELAKVRAAMAAGVRLALVSGSADAGANPPTAAPPAALTIARPRGPRLAAIIDRNCFSSCMNFLQQVRATGDAVVLGEPTIGYSPFGEITRIALPSGRGALAIPSALFRTTQATREPFLPDHAFAGSMSDDAALQAWVGQVLDRVDAGQGERSLR